MVMKVVIRDGGLNFVTGSEKEMEYISNACPVGVVARDVVNGLMVTGSKEKLFDLLLAVCAKYDVDLV